MYLYYHCTSSCKKRDKAENTNEQFVKDLEKISSNEQSINLFTVIIKNYCKQTDKVIEVVALSFQPSKNTGLGKKEMASKNGSHSQAVIPKGQLSNHFVTDLNRLANLLTA